MKPLSFFLRICVCSLLFCVAVWAAEIPVPNGDFEQPLENTWKTLLLKEVNGSIERSAIQPAEGAYCAWLHTAAGRGGFLELWSTPFKLPACSRLRITFQYRCGQKNQAAVQLVFTTKTDGKNTTLNLPAKFRLEKQEKWTPAELIVEIPEKFRADNLSVRIKVSHFAAHEEYDTWLDSFQFHVE